MGTAAGPCLDEQGRDHEPTPLQPQQHNQYTVYCLHLLTEGFIFQVQIIDLEQWQRVGAESTVQVLVLVDGNSAPANVEVCCILHCKSR